MSLHLLIADVKRAIVLGFLLEELERDVSPEMINPQSYRMSDSVTHPVYPSSSANHD